TRRETKPEGCRQAARGRIAKHPEVFVLQNRRVTSCSMTQRTAPPPPPLSPIALRELALAALVDPRTLTRALRAQPVQHLTREPAQHLTRDRRRRTLEQRGELPLLPEVAP